VRLKPWGIDIVEEMKGQADALLPAGPQDQQTGSKAKPPMADQGRS